MGKPLNAYVREHYRVQPVCSGELDGLTFAVKDVFDLEGHTNTAGNPSWKKTHSPARSHAPAIRRLLEAGAALRGITHTDELMYSLNGDNWHYGTPLNPAAPDCLPGGSSSGSASAVAAGLADFALGTDTGGSVRIPSAYCGLYGIRPTHGAVSAEGVIPLAGSFDTVGWMARDPVILRKVGEVLLHGACGGEEAGIGPIFAPRELWASAEEEVRMCLQPLADMHKPEWIELASGDLGSWADTFRLLQGYEIRRTHGGWIDRVKPRFGPDIGARMEWTRTVGREEYEKHLGHREAVRSFLEKLLEGGGVLLFPTAPCPAPRIGLGAERMDRIRALLLRHTCAAGLAGLPQVTVPVRGPEGRPVGLSLAAAPRRDRELLLWAERLYMGSGF